MNLSQLSMGLGNLEIMSLCLNVSIHSLLQTFLSTAGMSAQDSPSIESSWALPRLPAVTSSSFLVLQAAVPHSLCPNPTKLHPATSSYLAKHHPGHNEVFPNPSRLKISIWRAPSFSHHSEKWGNSFSEKRFLPCQVSNTHWPCNTLDCQSLKTWKLATAAIRAACSYLD